MPSCGVASAQLASTEPVAGSSTVKRAPPVASRHWPPISSPEGTVSRTAFWVSGGIGSSLLVVRVRCGSDVVSVVVRVALVAGIAVLVLAEVALGNSCGPPRQQG